MQPINPAHPGRVLVVDDNKVSRLLLARGLEQQGHVVTFAANGQQALDRLRCEPFDLVLLDIQMPEVDGYQVLAQLTADGELRNIPVIVTTSVEELDSVVRCIELGAEDYLAKPINAVLLRARISASLEKKRLRDQQRDLIRRFAAGAVADDLLSSGFELGVKPVEATVLFTDIRAFTGIVASHSLDDTLELLNTYYTLMFDAIEGHGGIVNQFIGDGLMAVFGAPLPQADHREQAARAALEMIELIELFNQDQTSRKRVPIHIGIGMASGAMIAGYIGTVKRATYTCVGDTVILAKRLEELTREMAAPILIDAHTQQGLDGVLRTEALGLVPIRGLEQPVAVYALPLEQTV